MRYAYSYATSVIFTFQIFFFNSYVCLSLRNLLWTISHHSCSDTKEVRSSKQWVNISFIWVFAAFAKLLLLLIFRKSVWNYSNLCMTIQTGAHQTFGHLLPFQVFHGREPKGNITFGLLPTCNDVNGAPKYLKDWRKNMEKFL